MSSLSQTVVWQHTCVRCVVRTFLGRVTFWRMLKHMHAISHIAACCAASVFWMHQLLLHMYADGMPVTSHLMPAHSVVKLVKIAAPSRNMRGST